MAVGETEDPIRPALFRASRGQSPSPETGSRNPRVTLDRPLYLRGLGLPIWKVGVGTPVPHRGGQCGGQTSDGAKRKTGKGDRDRTSRRGRVSQALTLGPAWTTQPAGSRGEAEAGTCNVSSAVKTESGRRRARQVGMARRMKTRRSPRDRDTGRGPSCTPRPCLTVPECRPHGTSRRKHGPGLAPGASEAAWPRVPGKGRTAHPCPEPAVRGLTVSPPRRQLGRPGVTAAAG